MSNPSVDDAPELDLKQIFAQLMARKWLIAVVSVIGACVGVAFAVIPPNEYRASSVVQIERRNDGISLPAELIGELLTGAKGGSSNFGTEIHVIKSRLTLEPAAQELGLLTEVRPKTLPIWGDFFLRTDLDEQVGLLDRYVSPSYARGEERLSIGALDLIPQLENVSLELTVLDAKTYRLTIDGQTFEGRVGTPTSLTPFGDIIVDEMFAPKGRVFYIRRVPTRTIVSQLSRGLGISERRDTGIIDFTYTGLDADAAVPILNTIIATYQSSSLQRRSAEIDQSIAFISGQLPVLRQELEMAQTKLAEFRQENGVGELSIGTQDLLARIIEFETTVERLDFEIEEVLKRVTTNHPDYQALAQERERVTARLSAAKRDLETIPEAEQNLALLTRELERARSLELQLAERIEQLRILKASAVGNVRVLEPAEVAVLAGPDRLTPILLGLLAGFVIASIWIFVRNYLHTGIEDGRELEDMGLPLFATISEVADSDINHSKGAYPMAATNTNHPIVEAFRGLRTGLQFSLSSAQNKSVLITSSTPSEGKSFISQNLAVVMASAQKKVLLVDADMRRGKLRRVFGLDGTAMGLSELLSDAATIENAIHPTEIAGLDIVPTGKRPPNPAELLDRPLFKEFLSWAETEYDYVVVDAPPVLAVTDPIIIGHAGVVTLLVVRHTQTAPSEVEAVMKIMENSGLKASGAILNGYDQKRSKYGSYGYKYGYYYGGYSYRYKYNQSSD